MKKIILFLMTITTIARLNAQQQDQQSFQSKYHMMDSTELYAPMVASKSFTATPPPSGTVRAIAEWEPTEAVIVSYNSGFGIPYSLIAEMSENCKVITIVESSSQQTTVTNAYTNNGVNLANCIFQIAPLDSYWSRDYCPWFIMTNNNTVAIIDFPYNRPLRVNDDNVPVVMASYLSEPLYGMNIFHTGGNFMCDGIKAAAMTDLVIEENTSFTEPQIDTMFKQYMGITNNFITNDPLGDYIKHIDCWGKFLDVDKILIAKVPTSNSHYADYESTAAYWASQVSSYGNNYQVFRVYEPNGQPYTNSYILNKKVLVPIKGGSSVTYDNQALAVYQQAMPGYEIIGVTQLSSEPWVSTDALHCRTHEVADKGMLYMKHLPLLGGKTWQAQFNISANIYALSGSPLIADSVWMKYRINHGAWNKVLLTGGTNNLYSANIPGQNPGDTIEYFLHASDQSPRSVNHPIIGASDPHKFYISPSISIQEITAPEISVFPNPAVDKVFVQNKSDNMQSAYLIQLCDAMGNLVKSIKGGAGNSLVKIDLGDVSAGIYSIKVITAHGTSSKKIVVLK